MNTPSISPRFRLDRTPHQVLRLISGSAFAITSLFLSCLSTHAQSPFYEETFNSGGETVKLLNDATISGPGAGASGKTDDLCYDAENGLSQGPGPLASIVSELPSEPMEEFTITAWIKAKGATTGNILNTRGVVLSTGESNWYLRVNDSQGTGAGEKYYNSGTAISATPGEWQFVAVTWNRADNSARFYTGNKTSGTALATEIRQKGEAPLLGFSDPKFVRAIGNTYARSADGAFIGLIDNVRMFNKALEPEQLEAIRKADAENQPYAPALK